MKKLFTLAIVASVMFACSKEQPVITSVTNTETGAVVFNMNAPGFVVQNAPGLRNAAGPSSFSTLNDIKAMLFFGVNGLLAYNDDITSSIAWEGNNGNWTGSPLSKAVGAYRSLVVFNSAAMYDNATNGAVSTTTNVNNIRFHLAPESAYSADKTTIVNSDGIYEIAASTAVGSGLVTTANKTTPVQFSGEVKRINNKLNINVAYNQSTMFPNLGTGEARIRVARVVVNGIRESVDFDGANAAGSVAIARAFKSNDNATATELLLNSDKDNSAQKVGAADNVLSTLAFPFAANGATVRVELEYTYDNGNTWTPLNLQTFTINKAVGRNQVLNVNVFVLSISGDINYDFTFTDWDKSLGDVVFDGEEE